MVRSLPDLALAAGLMLAAGAAFAAQGKLTLDNQTPIVFEGGKWVRLARGEHIADPAGDQHGGHVPQEDAP